MKKPLVTSIFLLMCSTQAFGESDRICHLNKPISGLDKVTEEINNYVLERCQDGDVLTMSRGGYLDAAKICKMGTIVTFHSQKSESESFLCEYREQHRTRIPRPTSKEWKQIKKDLKKEG